MNLQPPRPSPHPASSLLGQRPALALIAFAVFLFALRLALVAGSGASLHVDEAQYWHWSRELHWGYFSKPPLIAALIRASTALFGDGVLGVKALAMACYPVTAIVLLRLGTEIADVRCGVLAALLFLSSPLVGILGMAASSDAPLLLAWSAALWAAWRALRPDSAVPVDRRYAAWAALGAAVGVGFLAKYTMAAFVPSALMLIALRVRPLPWRGLAVAAAVALVLIAPHLAWNISEHWPTLRHTAEITTEAAGGAQRGGPLVALAGYVGTQIAVVGPFLLPCVMVWAVLAWRRRAGAGGTLDAIEAKAGTTATAPGETAAAAVVADPRRSAALQLLLWTALPLIALGGLQAINAKAQPNWVAPAHVSLLLALALWAGAAPSAAAKSSPTTKTPSTSHRRWLALFALVQLLLITAVAEMPTFARVWQRERTLPPALDLWARMRGWDNAFALLHDQAARYRGGIVVGTNRTVIAQAAYHWRDLDLRFVAFNPGGEAHDHYQWSTHWPPLTKPGEPVLLLGDAEFQPELRLALRGFQNLASAHVPRSPGRFVDIRIGVGVLAQPAVASR
jgi:4-amino-4-deoxy-L-arabinose transferase-like glycosyltransferase